MGRHISLVTQMSVLVTRGGPSRIQAQGHGGKMPVATASTVVVSCFWSNSISGHWFFILAALEAPEWRMSKFRTKRMSLECGRS